MRLGESVAGRQKRSRNPLGQVPVIFSHASVDAMWMQEALVGADSAVVVVTLDFMCSLVDSPGRIDSIRKAARRYKDDTQDIAHAWYGADSVSVDRFKKHIVEAFENYLLRHAREGQASTVLCPYCSFDDHRMAGLATWMAETWPAMRMVLAINRQNSSDQRDYADVLGEVLLAAQNRAEIWFTDGMSVDAASEFVENWLEGAR